MTQTHPQDAADAAIAAIESLFARRGHEIYGETVTQLEHALQCAAAAADDDAPPELVTAALLHDVGHMLHPDPGGALADDADDRHEAIGAQWLRQWFPVSVTQPIALHVAAKRCLVRVDPAYAAALSPVSLRTLQLQGGPMETAQAHAFVASPTGHEAVRLRRWDELAKQPGMRTAPLAHFLAFARACLP
jgi:phosphonate degradation associated HDIG domain protein